MAFSFSNTNKSNLSLMASGLILIATLVVWVLAVHPLASKADTTDTYTETWTANELTGSSDGCGQNGDAQYQTAKRQFNHGGVPSGEWEVTAGCGTLTGRFYDTSGSDGVGSAVVTGWTVTGSVQ
jgi:hypothetical protein